MNTPEIKPITTGTEPMKKETQKINYIEIIAKKRFLADVCCDNQILIKLMLIKLMYKHSMLVCINIHAHAYM